MAQLDLTCLFSHKCEAPMAHGLGVRVQGLFRQPGIDLLIDPFRVGDQTKTRAQTIDFDSLLFLACPLSLESEYCQLELNAARQRSVPVFSILLDHAVPEILKTTIYWRPSLSDTARFIEEVAQLAVAIRTRAGLARNLRLLGPETPPDVSRESAEAIACRTDRTLVAEAAGELANRYLRVTDPTARFWIAQALGHAGTPEAARLLSSLPRRDHPYALEGIRQAIETIQGKSKWASPRPGRKLPNAQENN
jgi:hypothetical protein